MKNAVVIVYIMKIMGRDFKKIRSSRFRDNNKARKVKVLNEVALGQAVSKTVSF